MKEKRQFEIEMSSTEKRLNYIVFVVAQTEVNDLAQKLLHKVKESQTF